MLKFSNTEQTVPSSPETSFLSDNIIIDLNNRQLEIDVYDTSLGKRWINAVKDNLEHKRILEKNFCFLGWADSDRDLRFLVTDLNKHVEQINSFKFDPPYQRLDPFSTDDFQFSQKQEYRLKHEACNLLHRYFEDLQGNAWSLSKHYKQADYETKYAIRQLNNICHEIESWVLAYRKKYYNPEWMRPSQIVTFLNAPRYEFEAEDYELFKQNRYDRDLGGVYLHWSQIGKTLFEVFRDEDAPKMSEAMCSEINHQVYWSGEFDIEWGQTVNESRNEFKRAEMDAFRKWLFDNGYDWDNPTLALGYIKVGQINMKKCFNGKPFLEVYDMMKNNLNISNIRVNGSPTTECHYSYTLESEDWKKMQIEYMKPGYDWSRKNV